jgi:hypothetical protein
MISPYLSAESSRKRLESFVKDQAKKVASSPNAAETIKRYPAPLAAAILNAARTGTVDLENLYVG